jgi:hypothetical protein
MFPAWVRGKEPLQRLALMFVFAVSFATCAGTQEPPKAKTPVARTIILPQKLVAGAPATLAALDFAGRLLPNVVVELSGGRRVTTDATGRALFVAPAEAGRLTAKILGQEITASSTVILPADFSAQRSAEGPSAVLQLASYPHVLAIHDRFTIEGRGFRGIADVNHVSLADQPCLVVASSPISLVVLPGPHVPVGATSLRVSVAGYDTGPIPVSAVLLEFSGPPDAPDAGTQGKIILRVLGATEPLAVEVRNGSPAIIQFPGGSVQRLATSGGDENIAPVELKFLAPGNYTLTARLIPADSSSPPGRN